MQPAPQLRPNAEKKTKVLCLESRQRNAPAGGPGMHDPESSFTLFTRHGILLLPADLFIVHTRTMNSSACKGSQGRLLEIFGAGISNQGQAAWYAQAARISALLKDSLAGTKPALANQSGSLRTAVPSSIAKVLDLRALAAK